MKICKIALSVMVFQVVASAFAAEAGAEERSLFGKWRFAVGGAFNGGVSTDLGPRNLPRPGPAYVVPAGSTEADARRRADVTRDYDGGGFIRADSENDGYKTENWRLPSDSEYYHGDGAFTLYNTYERIVNTTYSGSHWDNSDDPCQYGLSFELSRELYVYDEKAERRWGVDFAAALSYFFPREIYDAHGTVLRQDEVETGRIRTDVHDPAATYDYDYEGKTATGGMLGDGAFNANHVHPSLLWGSIVTPSDDVGGPTRTETCTGSYSAWGDYQELEMMFLLRPWYEITDWWRVFANVGVGVSWGRFDSEIHGTNVGASEDFEQWDVYGVAGLGTVIRYGRFDISLDVFGRFLRDDMDVDGRYVHGSIERSAWGFRVMAGFEF